jgi:hypothetical protein
MNRRPIILTLVVTSLAFGAQAAQAQLLVSDSAVAVAKTSSAKSLAIMKVAGTRFHAQSNYGNQGGRPDDRSGVRGA